MEPVIQWVGGKKRLLNVLNFLKPMEYNNYFEGFLGGGALLFNLSEEHNTTNVYGIEYNKNIYQIYENIKQFHVDILLILEVLSKEYLSIKNENFDIQKEARKKYYIEKRLKYNSLEYNTVENSILKTTLLLFINKTCFNSLYRENSSGKFNVPFGNGKDCLIFNEERINNLHKYLNDGSLQIFNEDFTYLKQIVKEEDLVYLDPPYYPLKEDSFTSYDKEGFGIKQHNNLIELILELTKKNVKIILSNSNNNYFKEKLANLNCYKISIARTLNCDKEKRQKSVCEMILTNYHPPNRIIEVNLKSLSNNVYSSLSENNELNLKENNGEIYLYNDTVSLIKFKNNLACFIYLNNFLLKIKKKFENIKLIELEIIKL